GPISISPTPGIEPLPDQAGHTAADLVDIVLTVELADDAAKAHQNRVDGAFMDGSDLDAMEGEALIHAREIFHVTGEPVERLDDDHVEFTRVSILEHVVEGFAAM